MKASVDICMKLPSLVFMFLLYEAMNPQGWFPPLYRHVECYVERCVAQKAFPCSLLWAWLGMADVCNTAPLQVEGSISKARLLASLNRK